MGGPRVEPPSAAILEALSDAIVVVAGERIVWANHAAVRWLGRTELEGSALTAIFAPGEPHRLQRLVEQRAAGWPIPSSFRFGFVGARGEPLMADVRLADLPTGELVLSARDVTDLTRAERLMGNLALFSSEPRILQGPDALLDASAPIFDELGWTVAFTEITASGSTTLRVISASESAVGTYGRSLVGVELPLERTPVVAEVVRTRQSMFLDNLPLLLEGAPSAAKELSRSMLEARVARSAWSPILDGERVSHVLAVTGRDLTEHDFVAIQLFAAQLGASLRLLRLSTELVRKERLAAVGEMAAVLAHEVRSPIGVMFNALGLMRRTADGPDREPLMAILLEEAQRLKQLVHDLLDFSGPKTTVRHPVDLPALVRAALETARVEPAFQEKQPVVELDLGETTRLVLGSETLLRRAVLNLLQNALQHVGPGGRVRVSLTHGDRACLRVANDGPPIPPDTALRIFEPFFTTQPRGTGLGLAIVQRIAVDLGGTVRLEPSDEGVSFALELDYAERGSSPAVVSS